MDETKAPFGAPWRNFYGRRRSHGMKPTQKTWLAEDLQEFTLPGVSWEENPERVPLDMGAIFGGREVWLEIGFGGGEHLAHLAASNPDVGLIGAEPYINGVAMLLGKLRAAKAEHLAILPGDARDLFDVLPEGALSRAYLLYPDPWPKRAHHRRRFVTQEHLVPLARAMKPGAELRIATDIADYVRQALVEVPKAGFERIAEQAADQPWEGWYSTRYEQKALRAGRPPTYLRYRKG